MSNKVCTFLPALAGGYDAGCATLTDITDGRDLTVVGGERTHNRLLIAVVVPDGMAAPIIHEGSGGSRKLRVYSNVAAAFVRGTDTLEIAGRQVALHDVYARPPSSR